MASDDPTAGNARTAPDAAAGSFRPRGRETTATGFSARLSSPLLSSNARSSGFHSSVNCPGRAVRLLPMVMVKAGRPIEPASGPATVARGTAGADETIRRTGVDVG